MAASTLTAKQHSKTIRQKKKNLSEKVVLDTPFQIEWPAVKDVVVEQVLSKLASALQPLGHAHNTISRSRHQMRKKGKTDAQSQERVCAVEETYARETALRKQLAIGFNKVTRGLERNDLRLVVVDRSTKPPFLTQHLVGLCATRECPAICVDKLTPVVGPAVGASSLSCLGFKKINSNEADAFGELVAFITTNSPPITLPWQRASVSDEQSSDEESEKSGVCDTPMQSVAETVGSDFSSLYLLKKDTMKNHPSFSRDHYIQFSKESSSDGSDDENSNAQPADFKQKTLKRKKKHQRKGESKKKRNNYRTLNIVRMGKNPNR